MYYNHVIRTPGEETFTYGEIVIRLWNYSKGMRKSLRGTEDHIRRLYNFDEYISDTRIRDGYANKPIEAQVGRFLYENWEEYL